MLVSLSNTVQAGRPVGAIIKTANSDALYIMVPIGKKAHIPSVRALNCLQLQNRVPVVVSDAEFSSYPSTPLLIKSPRGEIYLVEGDKKRHIVNPAAFQRHNYDPVTVLPMLDPQIYCLEDGPEIR